MRFYDRAQVDFVGFSRAGGSSRFSKFGMFPRRFLVFVLRTPEIRVQVRLWLAKLDEPRLFFHRAFLGRHGRRRPKNPLENEIFSHNKQKNLPAIFRPSGAILAEGGWRCFVTGTRKINGDSKVCGHTLVHVYIQVKDTSHMNQSSLQFVQDCMVGHLYWALLASYYFTRH